MFADACNILKLSFGNLAVVAQAARETNSVNTKM
jgi:hypothetical protein